MIKKSVTYKKTRIDLEGNFAEETVTEDFFFNINKAEALEVNLMEDLENVGKSTDPKAIIPTFKRIVLYSYGVRLPDGRFSKDPSKTDDFLASDAYSELFLSLLDKGERGVTEFIEGALNFNAEEAAKEQKKAAAAPQDRLEKAQPKKFEDVETVKVTETKAEPMSKPVDSSPEQVGETRSDNMSYQEYLEWKKNQPKEEPLSGVSSPGDN